MNERKELIEYRTSNSKYFLKKDGTIEVEIYDKNILLEYLLQEVNQILVLLIPIFIQEILIHQHITKIY